jgi:hypothetical protein
VSVGGHPYDLLSNLNGETLTDTRVGVKISFGVDFEFEATGILAGQTRIENIDQTCS